MRLTFADLQAPVPEAPAVERELAFDMLKRGLWFAPAIVIARHRRSGAATGVVGPGGRRRRAGQPRAGRASLSWAARRSLTLLMAVALGGFAVRMGLVTVVLLLVKDQPWIDLVALG